MGLDIDNTDDGEVVAGDRVRFDPDRSEWIVVSTETDSDGFVYGTVARVEKCWSGGIPPNPLRRGAVVRIEPEYLPHFDTRGVEQGIELDIVERVGVND